MKGGHVRMMTYARFMLQFVSLAFVKTRIYAALYDAETFGIFDADK